jgi:hypothetical protein
MYHKYYQYTVDRNVSTSPEPEDIQLSFHVFIKRKMVKNSEFIDPTNILKKVMSKSRRVWKLEAVPRM